VRFNECWSDPLWHEESGGVGHEWPAAPAAGRSSMATRGWC